MDAKKILVHVIPTFNTNSHVKKVEDFKIKEEANRTIKISFTVILNDGSPIKFNESVGA